MTFRSRPPEITQRFYCSKDNDSQRHIQGHESQGWAWWHAPDPSIPERLRQEDCRESDVSLGYLIGPCLKPSLPKRIMNPRWPLAPSLLRRNRRRAEQEGPGACVEGLLAAQYLSPGEHLCHRKLNVHCKDKCAGKIFFNC